jgi:superoxide dismutase, Cu-Zn family
MYYFLAGLSNRLDLLQHFFDSPANLFPLFFQPDGLAPQHDQFFFPILHLLPHALRIPFGRNLSLPSCLEHLYGAINFVFERLKIVCRNLLCYLFNRVQRHDCTLPSGFLKLLRSILHIFVDNALHCQVPGQSVLGELVIIPAARRLESMKRLACFTFGLFFALFALPSRSAAKTKVELKDAQGKPVGDVILWDQGPGIALEVKLHDLTPGVHAIHFHQVPKCEGPDFKSAGGHFNPENKKHGFENPEGHHAGDMKNFTVLADGKASAHLDDKDVTLKEGPHSLLTNGAAIVVHAKADDYKTDPSGNSGDRIACGVLTK